MNYARVIGKVISEHHRKYGCLYVVRTRRSGKRDVYDDIYVTLVKSAKRNAKIEVGSNYEFIGKIGLIEQAPVIYKNDICIYANTVLCADESDEWKNEVIIAGTIISKETNPKIPNKISMVLDPNDIYRNTYRIVAWNRRLEYIEKKNVGDSLNIFGELVKYDYRMHIQEEIKWLSRIEIAFWYEAKK